MPKIEIYTKDFCPYCHAAKELLDRKGVSYTEYDVTNDPVKIKEMEERSERRTVPEIFINDKLIGGFDDLNALEQDGKLDPLLKD
ncbi:glutaredoxin 3 [Candidatus Woesearchaeota archaeon]|nr:glutaredoxin 3 [Candidatus Woesearchaeota archaeon]